jgi:hypothetical protein
LLQGALPRKPTTARTAGSWPQRCGTRTSAPLSRAPRQIDSGRQHTPSPAAAALSSTRDSSATILPRHAAPGIGEAGQIDKKVRVVSTIEYLLGP